MLTQTSHTEHCDSVISTHVLYSGRTEFYSEICGRIKWVKFSWLPSVPPDKCRSKDKAVSLHAMKAHVGRGGIAPTHSQPRQ
jgi:hypothetical protein